MVSLWVSSQTFPSPSVRLAQGPARHGSQLRLEGHSVVKLETGKRCIPTQFPELWLSDVVNYLPKVNEQISNTDI